MKLVTLLIPCFNEEKSLPLLWEQLKSLIDSNEQYLWQILFVNDGSRDNTLPILKQLAASDSRVSYVSLSRNFGKETPCWPGLTMPPGTAW